MKGIKRLVSMMLVLVMTVSMLPMQALAEETGLRQGLQEMLDSQHTNPPDEITIESGIGGETPNDALGASGGEVQWKTLDELEEELAALGTSLDEVRELLESEGGDAFERFLLAQGVNVEDTQGLLMVDREAEMQASGKASSAGIGIMPMASQGNFSTAAELTAWIRASLRVLDHPEGTVLAGTLSGTDQQNGGAQIMDRNAAAMLLFVPLYTATATVGKGTMNSDYVVTNTQAPATATGINSIGNVQIPTTLTGSVSGMALRPVVQVKWITSGAYNNYFTTHIPISIANGINFRTDIVVNNGLSFATASSAAAIKKYNGELISYGMNAYTGTGGFYKGPLQFYDHPSNTSTAEVANSYMQMALGQRNSPIRTLAGYENIPFTNTLSGIRLNPAYYDLPSGTGTQYYWQAGLKYIEGLDQMTNLQYFWAPNNYIFQIGSGFNGKSTLKDVRLASNFIGKVDNLDGLTGVTVLDLRGNFLDVPLDGEGELDFDAIRTELKERFPAMNSNVNILLQPQLKIDTPSNLIEFDEENPRKAYVEMNTSTGQSLPFRVSYVGTGTEASVTPTSGRSATGNYLQARDIPMAVFSTYNNSTELTINDTASGNYTQGTKNTNPHTAAGRYVGQQNITFTPRKIGRYTVKIIPEYIKTHVLPYVANNDLARNAWLEERPALYLELEITTANTIETLTISAESKLGPSVPQVDVTGTMKIDAPKVTDTVTRYEIEIIPEVTDNHGNPLDSEDVVYEIPLARGITFDEVTRRVTITTEAEEGRYPVNAKIYDPLKEEMISSNTIYLEIVKEGAKPAEIVIVASSNEIDIPPSGENQVWYTVWATDQYGNTIPGLVPTTTMEYQRGLYYQRAPDGGTLKINNLAEAGTAKLTAKLPPSYNVPEAEHTLTLKQNPPEPKRIELVGARLLYDAGSTVGYTVQIYDQYNRLMTDTFADITASGSNADNITVEQDPLDESQFNVKILSAKGSGWNFTLELASRDNPELTRSVQINVSTDSESIVSGVRITSPANNHIVHIPVSGAPAAEVLLEGEVYNQPGVTLPGQQVEWKMDPVGSYSMTGVSLSGNKIYVNEGADAGQVRITAMAEMDNSKTASIVVSIQRGESTKPTSLELVGPGNVYVPTGDGIYETLFSGVVYDQYGREMNNMGIGLQWELTGAVVGMSVDRAYNPSGTDKMLQIRTTKDAAPYIGQKMTVSMSFQLGSETIAPITRDVFIGREPNIPTDISISGDVSIGILPMQDGLSQSVEKTYLAEVRDQNGDIISDARVTWDIKTPTTGVTIARQTGVLRVSSAAPDGDIYLIATCEDISAEFRVRLEREQEVPTRIEFTGEGSTWLRAPDVGKDSVSTTFKAKVYDQYGTEMPGETASIQYTFTRTDGTGVGINTNNTTATLTVDENVGEVNKYTITARFDTLSAELDITINPFTGGEPINTDPFISGSTFITIPGKGLVERREYTMARRNQNGIETRFEEAYFYLSDYVGEPLPEGIIMEQSDGRLTLYIHPEAPAGILKISAMNTAGNETAEAGVLLVKGTAVITEISVEGPNDALILPTGNNTVQYQAYALDQYGQKMQAGGAFTYTLTGTVPTGVSIHSTTGQVTVESTAIPDEVFTVQATLEGSGLTGEKTTRLVDNYTAEAKGIEFTRWKDAVSVPVAGQQTTEQFTARVIDQYGGTITGIPIYYTLEGASQGVSIGYLTGQMVVNAQAPTGTVLVRAQTTSGLSAVIPVMLTREIPELTKVEIVTPLYSVQRPLAGMDAHPLEAVAYDQYGDIISDAAITFEITDPVSHPGVSFDSTGALLIVPTANIGEYTIVAHASYGSASPVTSDPRVVYIGANSGEGGGENQGGLTGRPIIFIPLPGQTETEQYEYVRGGVSRPDEVIYWEVQGSPQGVEIDAAGLVTVYDDAQETSFVVRAYTAESGQEGFSLIVNLRYQNPEVTELILEGDEEVPIPPEASVANTVKVYTARVYDQYGRVMAGERVNWSIDPASLPTGVTFANGMLTVTAEAMSAVPIGSLTIRAESARKDTVYDEIPVNLIDVSGSLIRDINIQGVNEIAIPAKTESAVSQNFVATIHGYTGIITGAVVDWSVRGALPAGVRIEPVGNQMLLTVEPGTKPANIILVAEYDGFIRTHTVELKRDPSAPQSTDDMYIDGSEYIFVSDLAPGVETYNVVVTDQYGDEYTAPQSSVRWETALNYAGVILNQQTGTLTVLPSVVTDEIILHATMEGWKNTGDLMVSKSILVYNSGTGGDKEPKLSVEGYSAITIPETGGVSGYADYKLMRDDPVTGQITQLQDVYWYVKDGAPAGVTLGSSGNTGEIRVLVADIAAEGEMILVGMDRASGDEAELPVKLVRDAAEFKGLKLDGPDRAPVPDSGKTVRAEYHASPLDQYGRPMQVPAVIVYALEDPTTPGVTIDENTGVVTIADDAVIGTTFEVTATLVYESQTYKDTVPTLLVNKDEYDPEPASIEIAEGGTPLFVPYSGDHTTYTYQAIVIDKYGNEISNPSLLWRFDGPSVEGVSIDASGGTVTVNQQARDSTVVVAVDCGGLTATKTVRIMREAQFLHSVKIDDGPLSLDRPFVGVEQARFSALGFSQYGEVMGNVEFTYKVTDDTITGVEFIGDRIVIYPEINVLSLNVQATGRLGEYRAESPEWRVSIDTGGSGEEQREVRGPGILYIPEPGGTANTGAYEMYINRFKRESGITFALDNTYPGVRLDKETGILTVSDTAQEGTVTVTAYTDEGTQASLDVRIRYEDAALRDIKLRGEKQIVIPMSDAFPDVQRVYAADIIDQYGRSVPYERISWSTDPAVMPAGVTFEDGVITVSQAASAGDIKLTVQSVSDPALTDSLTVSLLDQSDTTVRDIVITGVSEMIIPGINEMAGSESFTAAILTYGTTGVLAGPVQWSTAEPLPDDVQMAVSGNQVALTVNPAAEGARITLIASYDGYERRHEVVLKRGPSVPLAGSDISVSGDGLIYITETAPGRGEYQAKVKNQYGEWYEEEGIKWSLGSTYEGVFIDAVSGEVIALPTATVSQITVCAALEIAGGTTLTGEKNVLVYNNSPGGNENYVVGGSLSARIPETGTTSEQYTLYRNAQPVTADGWYVKEAVSGVSIDAGGVLQVTPQAVPGDITVVATRAGMDYTKVVTLQYKAGELTSLKLEGPEEAMVPPAGFTTEVQFAGYALDQLGNPMNGYQLVYELESPVAGVMVDSGSGLVTVSPGAAAGDTFTVMVTLPEAPGLTDKKTVTLKTYTQEAASIRMKPGGEQLQVPALGDLTQYTYEAEVLDAYGNEITGAAIGWKIDGEAPAGVSLNYATGELSVTSDAPSASVLITAQYEGLRAEKLVSIGRQSPILTSVRIISPPVNIEKPAVSTTAEFNAQAYDQYGGVISGALITFEIATPNVTGASFIGNMLYVDGSINVNMLAVEAVAKLGSQTVRSAPLPVSIVSSGEGTVSWKISGPTLMEIPSAGERTELYSLLRNDIPVAAGWILEENTSGAPEVDMATGEMKILPATKPGIYTLTAYPDAGGEPVSMSVRLVRERLRPHSVVVEGDAEVYIPVESTDEAAVKVYLATVYDQYGEPMPDAEVLWETDPAAISDSSIDFANGVLTVRFGAAEQSIKLTAKSKEDASAASEPFAVNIKDISASKVRRIEISGMTNLLVPVTGTLDETYTAALYNAANGVLSGTVEWQTADNLPEGVTAAVNGNQYTLTVSPAAQNGIITLYADFDGIRAVHRITVEREKSVPSTEDDIKIIGESVVSVESGVTTWPYQAEVTDQYRAKYFPDDAVWSIAGTYNGVYMDSETGILSILPIADGGILTITVQVPGAGGVPVTKSKEITVYKENSGVTDRYVGGRQSLDIPETGINTTQYTLYNGGIPEDADTWYIKEMPAAVVIDVNGLLSVGADAVPGTITVVAVKSGKDYTKEVELLGDGGTGEPQPGAGGRIEVTVLDAGETAVTGAQVDIGTAAKTTGADGKADFTGLLAGSYLVEVTHADYNTGYGFAELRTDEKKNVVVRLEANSSGGGNDAYSISGTVYELGVALEGIAVEAVNGTERFITDSAGRYIIAGIAPGDDTVLSYTKEGYRTEYRLYEAAAGDLVNRNVTMTRISDPSDGTATVYGTVLDAETLAPVAGAVVQISAALRGITGASGQYTITGVTPGSYVAAARADGYNTGSAPVQAQANKAVSADFLLTANSSGGGTDLAEYVITGQVMDEMGRPLSSATVTDGTATVQAGTNGMFVIGSYADGETVSLTAQAPGFTAQTKPVTINAADGEQDFYLEESSGGGQTGKRIEITAPANSVEVPVKGTAAQTLQMSARAFTGAQEQTNPEIFWQIEGGYPSGISIHPLTGLISVTHEASGGVISVSASWDGATAAKLIAIQKAESVAADIKIVSGLAIVEKPLTGTAQSPYTAEVYDQFGAVMNGQTVTWTADPGSFVIDGGVLYVESTSPAGAVEITAEAGGKEAKKTVSIRENETSGEETTFEVRGKRVIEIPASGTANSEEYKLYRNGVQLASGVTWEALTTLKNVTLDTDGKVSVGIGAASGEFTVSAEYGGKYYDYTVIIRRQTSEVESVELRGPSSIAIPNAGEAARQVGYEAVVYDQYGAVMQGETVYLSMTAVPTDPKVQFENGILTVEPGASDATQIEIRAEASGKTAEMPVTLEDVSGSLVSSLVVTGEQRLVIDPATGAQEIYKAKAYYYNGTAEDDVAAAFAIQGAAPYGVTIDPQTGEVEVLPDARNAQIVVEARFGGHTGTLTVNIVREKSRPKTANDLVILGANPIVVTGGMAQTEYRVTATDQYGEEFVPESPAWALQGSPSGIFIDEQSGAVTVMASSVADQITVAVTVDSVTKTRTIDIVREGGTGEPQPGTGSTIEVTVLDGSGTGIAGAQVDIGAASKPADAAGKADFTGLSAGDYLVMVTHANYNTGYGFVSLGTDDQKNVIVTLDANSSGGGSDLYSISGAVYELGVALEGVLVQQVNGAARIETDRSGRYLITGITPGEDVVLSYGKDGYRTEYRQFPAVSADLANQNVTLVKVSGPQAGRSTVYGTVLDADTYLPLEQATVTLNGQIYKTDANGFYLFENQTPGNYTVFFSKTGYLGQSVQVTAPEGKAVAADMLLKPDDGSGTGSEIYQITGRVTRISDGTGIAGATVSDGTKTVPTDAGGWYAIGKYADGAAVALSVTAVDFQPDGRTVTIETKDMTAHFAMEASTGGGGETGKRIEITSATNTVQVPVKDAPDRTLQLRAKAYTGAQEETDPEIFWQIEGGYPSGVSVHPLTGQISVTNEASAGVISVSASWDGVTATKLIAIEKARSAVTEVKIVSGLAIVEKPLTGTAQSPYTAEVYDQFGAVMNGQTVTWTADPGSFVIDGGVLYVESTSPAGAVEITAEAGGKEAKKTVSIRENETSGEETTFEVRGKRVIEIPASGTANSEEYKLYRNGVQLNSGVTWEALTTLKNVTLDTDGKVSVGIGAASGEFTVSAEYGGKYYDYTVTIRRQTSEVESVELRGPSSIAIPNAGEAARQVGYEAVVYDQYGAVMQGEMVYLSMAATPTDPKVQFENGILTVEPGASDATQIEIRAEASGKTAEMPVTLEDVSGSLISSLVVTGEQRLVIDPATGAQEIYKAKAYYYNGTAENDVAAAFAIQGVAPYGVTIDPQTGEVEVLPDARNAQIVVEARFGGHTGTLTVNIVREKSKPGDANDLMILGANPIVVTGGMAQTEYRVTATDQYGEEFTPDKPAWSLQGNPASIYMDSQSGAVTVMTASVADQITVEVTVDSVVQTRVIDIVREGGTGEPQPGTGSAIQVTVTDTLGTPVANARVDIGTADKTTGNDGKADFTGLTAGSYLVEVTHTDYNTGYGFAQLGTDDQKNVVVRLEANSSGGGSDAYSISGTVYELGVALEGVLVQQVNGAARIETDRNGRYLITGIAPGAETVLSYSKEGYRTGYKVFPAAAVNLVNQDVTLEKVPEPQTGRSTVYGTVLDGATYLPLEGVTVTMNGQTRTTDTNGWYIYENIAASNYTVFFSKTDYVGQSVQVTAPEGRAVAADAMLKPDDGTGTDPEIYQITGRVTRVSDGTGIAGASISDGMKTTLTDAGGWYAIGKYADGAAVTLSVTAADFQPDGRTVTIETRDMTANFALTASGGGGENPEPGDRGEVYGDKRIYIPGLAEGAQEHQYTYRIGNIPQSNVRWVLEAESGSGLRLDRDTGKLTVSSNAKAQEITITAFPDGGESASLSVNVVYETRVPAALALSGPEEVPIPFDDGQPDTEAEYTVRVTDQYGEEMQDAEVIWELTPDNMAGVTFDDGVLYVTSDAAEGTFTLTAESRDNAALFDTAEITLTDVADSVVWEIEIAGADRISVPELGAGTQSETYTAEVRSYTGSMLSEEVNWSIEGGAPQGVSAGRSGEDYVLEVGASAEGSLTICAEAGGIRTYHEVTLVREESIPQADSLEVTGDDAIYITDLALGSGQYAAQATDQYGKLFTPKNIQWSISGNDEGLLLSQTGKLTATPKAESGKIIVTAAVSDGQGGTLEAGMEVLIYNNAGGGANPGNPDPDEYSVVGAESIRIPAQGSVSEDYALYRGNTPITAASWETVEKPAGVTIGSDGKLTVSSDAAAGQLTIVATYGGQTVRKTIQLLEKDTSPYPAELRLEGADKLSVPQAGSTVSAEYTLRVYDQNGKVMSGQTGTIGADVTPADAAVSFDGKTLTIAAGANSATVITLTGTLDSLSVQKTVTLTETGSTGGYYTLEGPGALVIGQSTVQVYYAVMDDKQTVYPASSWSVSSASGVSIQDGLLSVAPQAQAGKVTVSAIYQGVRYSKEVALHENSIPGGAETVYTVRYMAGSTVLRSTEYTGMRAGDRVLFTAPASLSINSKTYELTAGQAATKSLVLAAASADNVLTFTYTEKTEGGNGNEGGGNNGGGGSPGGGGGGGGTTVPNESNAPDGEEDELYPELETEEHIPYISGYPDGTVRPDAPITRAETVVIFHRLLVDEEKDDARGASFKDVTAGQWYSQAVAHLSYLEVLTGYPDGTFRPNDNITRAEFTAILSRFGPIEGGRAQFSDVGGHWARDYIANAAVKGYVAGYPDGTFRPENSITRAEAVTMINRLLSREMTMEEAQTLEVLFHDLAETHWGYADVVEASILHDLSVHE